MASKTVKQEILERATNPSGCPSGATAVIDLGSSSDSDSEVEDGGGGGGGGETSSPGKRTRVSDGAGEGSKRRRSSSALPLGFLDPLPLEDEAAPPLPIAEVGPARVPAVAEGSRQFWKAGDYDGSSIVDSLPSNGIIFWVNYKKPLHLYPV